MERPCASSKEKARGPGDDWAAIIIILAEISVKLGDPARIGKAAEACANAGSVVKGVSVAMDTEQLLYEAGYLQDAATLLRLSGG